MKKQALKRLKQPNDSPVNESPVNRRVVGSSPTWGAIETADSFRIVGGSFLFLAFAYCAFLAD